jgi:hypothetical protein
VIATPRRQKVMYPPSSWGLLYFDIHFLVIGTRYVAAVHMMGLLSLGFMVITFKMYLSAAYRKCWSVEGVNLHAFFISGLNVIASKKIQLPWTVLGKVASHTLLL